MTEVEDWRERMEKNAGALPYYMRDGILLYVLKGIPPGDFLTKVLSNDLMGAYDRADTENTRAMRDWVIFLYNYVPSECFGSPVAVDRWISRGGLEGPGKPEAERA